MPLADTPPEQQFLAFIRGQGSQLRGADEAPEGLVDWRRSKPRLRQQLQVAWGGFAAEPGNLNPKVVGVLERDGYRVEKVTFETRPGVVMTANLYLPTGEGKRPAVLCVHGHWKGAKQDPVVQARCLGLVKLGFVVLVVDAFGAGERGIGKELGQYHGEMVGATLLPVGLPLSGLQVYENMRAVDFLLTRPEVDGERLGITGASGGGNQSMYAGAYDERFRCVVPVCSVGNFQAYLGAACCMCEVVPGVLGFCEEWNVLSLCAPRGLMIINATKDAPQFSVAEAKKSVARIEHIYKLFDAPQAFKHAIFESPHDYNQAMREAMYGWMTLHLKGEGDGSPIAEPALKTEEPEALRCFPGDSRPDDFVTIPMFAAARGRLLVKKLDDIEIQHPEHWESTAERLRFALGKSILGKISGKPTLGATREQADGQNTYTIESEPDLQIRAVHVTANRPERRLALLLHFDGSQAALETPTAKALRDAGWDLVAADLRATGKYAVPNDKIGGAPDHNSGEWGLLVDRPLLGQWVIDVRRIVETLIQHEPMPSQAMTCIGFGPAGVLALCAAQDSPRIKQVATIGTLATLVTDKPYAGQRLGILAPGILRDVGDIAHLAALAAPRRLVIAGATSPTGESLTAEQTEAAWKYPRTIYSVLKVPGNLRVISDTNPLAVAKGLGDA